ncbi:MAG: lysylphosphatidylglycerol synthase transmembrane domain-containing protein [archaeon]
MVSKNFFKFNGKGKFLKYLFYLLNLVLFGILVFYAVKYYPTMAYSFGNAHIIYLIISLIILIIINFICAFKWFILMKAFNKDVGFKYLLLIFMGSSLYKYIPPKGINYIMRYRFCQKYNQSLKGKISTMFCESISEIYVSTLCFLILTLILSNFTPWVFILTIIVFLLMTIFMIFPKLFLIIKIRQVEKLILQFMQIQNTKVFLNSFLLTFLVAILHGIAFYCILISFNVHLNFWIILLLFYSSQFIVFLSFTPAGIGVRELSLVGILTLLNVDIGLSITLAILNRILILIGEMLPGLPSLFILHKKK